MPRLTRREIVPEDQIGVFHCIQRCVRRAFLSGFDHATQKNFDHRKTWTQNRWRQLASLFEIDVRGYAVMSNHLHVILRTRPDVVDAWTDVGVMIMIAQTRNEPRERLDQWVAFAAPWRKRTRSNHEIHKPHEKNRGKPQRRLSTKTRAT